MVFGGVESERLQISEKSLWTGGPGSEGGYDFGLPADSQAALMRSIGKQLLDGAQLEPEAVAKQLGRKMHNYGDYQSFGDLIIERESDGTPVSDYRRELDLDTAIARVKFKQGDAGFRREYFVSYPDQVLVGALVQHQRAEAARALRGARQPQRDQLARQGTRITVSGALKSNGLKYAAELRVIPECGTVTADGDSLRIESECPVDLRAAARTNYRMRYPDYRDAGADPGGGVAKDATHAGQGSLRPISRPPPATITRRCFAAWRSTWSRPRRSCPPTSCARNTAAATRPPIARSSSCTSTTAATC